jgi:cbb3-type cytochrome oxidase subunit 3
MRKLIGIPVIIAFFIAVIYIAGIWDYILEKNFFFGEGSNVFGTVIFIVIIVGTIWFVMRETKIEKDEKDKK